MYYINLIVLCLTYVSCWDLSSFRSVPSRFSAISWFHDSKDQGFIPSYSVIDYQYANFYVDHSLDCFEIFKQDFLSSLFTTPTCPSSKLCPHRYLFKLSNSFLCAPIRSLDSDIAYISTIDYPGYSINFTTADLYLKPLLRPYLIQTTKSQYLTTEQCITTNFYRYRQDSKGVYTLIPPTVLVQDNGDSVNIISPKIRNCIIQLNSIPHVPYIFDKFVPPSFNTHALVAEQQFQDYLSTLYARYVFFNNSIYINKLDIDEYFSVVYISERFLVLNNTNIDIVRVVHVNTIHFSFASFGTSIFEYIISTLGTVTTYILSNFLDFIVSIFPFLEDYALKLFLILWRFVIAITNTLHKFIVASIPSTVLIYVIAFLLISAAVLYYSNIYAYLSLLLSIYFIYVYTLSGETTYTTPSYTTYPITSVVSPNCPACNCSTERIYPQPPPTVLSLWDLPTTCAHYYCSNAIKSTLRDLTLAFYDHVIWSHVIDPLFCSGKYCMTYRYSNGTNTVTYIPPYVYSERTIYIKVFTSFLINCNFDAECGAFTVLLDLRDLLEPLKHTFHFVFQMHDILPWTTFYPNTDNGYKLEYESQEYLLYPELCTYKYPLHCVAPYYVGYYFNVYPLSPYVDDYQIVDTFVSVKQPCNFKFYVYFYHNEYTLSYWNIDLKILLGIRRNIHYCFEKIELTVYPQWVLFDDGSYILLIHSIQHSVTHHRYNRDGTQFNVTTPITSPVNVTSYNNSYPHPFSSNRTPHSNPTAQYDPARTIKLN